jgi:hypothetical protein
MRVVITKSDYAGCNYDINRVERTLSINLTYPNLDDTKVNTVEINQESVRASDGIRMVYDYNRDGWSIQQPRSVDVLIEETETCRHYDCVEDWAETVFVQSWARQEGRILDD